MSNEALPFRRPEEDFLGIVDIMCNLDLLYQIADLTSNPRLAQIATRHALTTIASHIREDNSTYHVVNFDQDALTQGTIIKRFKNQGYSDTSCWSRGQAWGILGYVQCYKRTSNPVFLETAQRLAEYFITHLPAEHVTVLGFS